MEKELIAWREWSTGAFEEARRSKKPVILDITAVWCHWCHVMDETSYSDEGVAELIKRLYIPVRVDVDRRPDIAERYSFGGYPTTALLTSEGVVITGGTYVPPEQLKDLLQSVSDFYGKEEGVIIPPKEETKPPVKGDLGGDILKDVLDVILENFDSSYGGFGTQPKFPAPEAVDLALSEHRRSRDEVMLFMATKTLEGIQGIYDPVEGGFFRYSVTEDWKIPHYEKMLEVNAGLLLNYLRAYQATGRKAFRETAEGVLAYLSTHLYDPARGCFLGSQDADEEYYKFGKEERSKRRAPAIDRTVYADWNAKAAEAFLEASLLLDERWREQALRALDFLLANCCRDGRVYHYYVEGPELPGLLRDQVHVAKALSQAYLVTGEGRYLEAAQAITGHILGEYAAPEGGFFDTVERPEAIGDLKKKQRLLVENAAAADLLITLHHLTGREDYKAKAEEALKAFTGEYKNYRWFASTYAMAVERLLRPVQAIVLGTRGDPRTEALLKEALRIFEPRKVIIPLDPARDKERIKKLGYPLPEAPVAYICKGTVCLPPIKGPEEMAGKL